jgi:dipeptidase
MDYVRLALERSETAKDALQTIISLLHQYSQGGNCGNDHEFYYNNGFIIADRTTAFVLETVGKDWAWKKVQDIATLSNAISIETEWDECSHHDTSKRGGMISEPRAGIEFQHCCFFVFCDTDVTICYTISEFNWRKHHSDSLKTYFGQGHFRSSRSCGLLSRKKGSIDVPYMMDVLRDHGDSQNDLSTIVRCISSVRLMSVQYSCFLFRRSALNTGLTGQSVCMHASFGPVRRSNTTASWIVHLRPSGPLTIWATGSSAPCTSIFKPFIGVRQLPASLSDGSYWWQHEKLHRSVLADYSTRIQLIVSEQSSIERKFLEEEAKLVQTADVKDEDMVEFAQKCLDRALEVKLKWIQTIESTPHSKSLPFLYATFWRDMNRRAQLDIHFPRSWTSIIASGIVLVGVGGILALALKSRSAASK